MKNLINRFFAFANISYTMFTVRSNVKDGRKSPQIKPSAVFLSLILMVLFKKHSFLKLDQFMRTDAPKRFLGRDSRRLVAVSDTTISRSLSTYLLGPLRKYLKSVYIRASQLGKCKIDLCGRRLKAACVDGSQFGGFYGCVLQVLGEANLLLDIEPTTGKGKELPTTRTLLERAFQEYGAGFVDLFLLDGLYKDKKSINLILSKGSHILTKTTETRLNIIKDANGLFTHHEKFPGVDYQKGFDVDRLCEYQVWSCGSFYLHGVKGDIKVAHVKEDYIKGPLSKGKGHEDFWVLSTDESLSGLQMREGGHIRWRIENNGFKALDDQTNCDHVYTHNAHAFLALMLMLFIGWNLFLLFDLEGIRKGYEYVKWTLDFLSELLKIDFYMKYQALS
jgi:hypothetical protein